MIFRASSMPHAFPPREPLADHTVPKLKIISRPEVFPDHFLKSPVFCQRTLYKDIRAVSLEFMKSVDVTAIFGNLLENALRAAQRSKEPFVEISVERQKKPDFC